MVTANSSVTLVVSPPLHDSLSNGERPNWVIGIEVASRLIVSGRLPLSTDFFGSDEFVAGQSKSAWLTPRHQRRRAAPSAACCC